MEVEQIFEGKQCTLTLIEKYTLQNIVFKVNDILVGNFFYVYANGIMSRRLPTPGSLLTKKLVSSSLQRWAACRYSVWLSLLRLARGRSVFCTFWSFSSYLLVNRLPEHMAPCGSVCSVFTKCSQWDLTTVGGDVSWYLQRIAVKWGPASGSAVSRAQVSTLENVTTTTVISGNIETNTTWIC